MLTARNTLAFTLVVLVTTVVPAFGTDYTFDPEFGTEGDWSNVQNWIPIGDPTVGDTVTIPNGLTCLIANYSEAMDRVDIAEGGTLILGPNPEFGIRVLAIHGDENDMGGTIDGLFFFRQGDGLRPFLRWDDNVTLDGTGRISGREPGEASGGVIYALDMAPTGETLTIGADLVVQGEIMFVGDFVINGTVKIDHADDKDNFGELSTYQDPSDFSGTGEIVVSAGTLQFGHCTFGDSLTWTLSGGTIITNTDGSVELCDCGGFVGDLSISAGTLDINMDFCSEDKIEFRGGTIDVKAGKTFAVGVRCP